jgi:hypothetical protein
VNMADIFIYLNENRTMKPFAINYAGGKMRE